MTTDNNCSNSSIKQDIVEVITSDKKFAQKIADRMFWLLIYAGALLTTTFCGIFFYQAKNGCIGDFFALILNFFK